MTPIDERLFWYWVNERHRIYLKKQARAPKPWTDDPIFRNYKFTNVFRQLDTGTVWLAEHFLRPHADESAELLIFNIAWYRLFNWVGTGQRLGWLTDWHPDEVRTVLEAARNRGEQVFTGAHIIWTAGGQSKIRGVVGNCTEVWEQRSRIASAITDRPTLEHAFQAFTPIRGIGDFLAYEIVTDLRHTRLLDRAPDIQNWANAGPGALRGLLRLFPDMKRSEALDKMRYLLARSREPGVLEPHVPPLECRDIEHASCEFEKYCRVKFGEGKPRARYPGTVSPKDLLCS